MVNPVKVFEWKQVKGERHYEKVDAGTGEFCEWGCDYEEFETGAGNYSIAIVKMPDGTVKTPRADMVEFIQ